AFLCRSFLLNPPPPISTLFPYTTLFRSERRHDVRVLRRCAWIGMALLLVVSVALLARADEGRIEVYLLGDWPSRLGIVLMLDRLSALLVLKIGRASCRERGEV